ncbi:MAG: pyridoxal-phosphate dependent enzyme [Pseudomonadota bacterium]
MIHLQNRPELVDALAPKLTEIPFPSADAARARALISRCPVASVTPLLSAPSLAAASGVAEVWVKDERARMGMGSFKALGAAYVIARHAQEDRARGMTYVTASAGNHGLSVAAGAQVFGAKAVIFLADSVPDAFAMRLESLGATVRREGMIYEDSMAAAASFAETEGYVLLSDSSWPGYTELPHILMEGYLALMAEVADAMAEPPTHIFLQAGVGGLAVACAVQTRASWGKTPRVVVVEPAAAPALQASVQAGAPVRADGPVSSMGRLDCKEPSLIALKGLLRDADDFVTITEAEAEHGAEVCSQVHLTSTPSGAAGVAALLAADHSQLGLTPSSRALVILSEEPQP